MSCERYENALADVAAGGVLPAGLESHLGSCESCREELEVLRRALAVADEELAGCVSADPSPGLEARIREAVAGAEAVEEWRFAWLWPAAAVAATLLVALVLWLDRGAPPAPLVAAVPPAPPSAPAPVIPSGSVSPGREGPASGAQPRPRAQAPRPPRASRFAEIATPEVLVPPGEREALLRLVAVVYREGLSPAGLRAAGQPSPDLAEPALPEIEPIEIVPLDPAESAGT